MIGALAITARIINLPDFATFYPFHKAAKAIQLGF
jgi:hypothetical protein